MQHVELSEIISALGIVTAIGTASGAWFVGQYRLRKIEEENERNRTAHADEIREMKSKLGQFERERNDQHNSIMEFMRGIKDELGNRLTAIETTLKIRKDL